MSTSRSTGWPMRRIGKLRFLEIGVDPDFGQRADGHEALAGDDVVAGIHVAPRDDAVDFGNDVAIAQIQVGLIEIALGLGQLGLGLFDGRGVLRSGVDAVDVSLRVALVKVGDHLLGGLLNELVVTPSCAAAWIRLACASRTVEKV
jgi:hypothetical protein